MSLRRRLGAYLVVLHVLLFAAAALLFKEQPLFFIAAETALLLSLGLGFALLRQALEPLGYTRRFHDLLQDQNYANQLAAPASRELDELVGLFNTMLAALHRERLAAGEQQGFLDRLLEATPSAVVVFDFDGAVSLVNASAGSLLGLREAQGKRLASVVFAPGLDARARDLVAQLDALPAGEPRLLTDTEGRRYRAQRGQFYDRGFARHFLMVEELTAELEDSERATYAKLVRVLAHEVNNTVAATRSVLDSLLFYRSQLGESDAADFTTAIEAVKRRNVSLGEFIDRFTRVVKMPAPERRPASLQAMVDDILWLNRDQCARNGIRLGWRRCDSVEPVPLDAGLMEGALLNIVKNAIEAVMEKRAAAGYVELSLEKDASGIVLAVIDSADLLGSVAPRQLFTPFFSTRQGGQGIGLMFVREVLTRHGLAYSLASTGQSETRFEIRFPQPS